MRNNSTNRQPTLPSLNANPRLISVAAALCGSLVALGGCTGEAGEACGLSAAEVTSDEVADGRAIADRDGSSFNEPATYRLMGTDIVAGTLNLIVPKNEDGDDTADLIEAGTFPICIPVGERSETVGQVNLVDGAYVTNGDNTGNVVILGRDSGILSGRFAFDIVDPSGTVSSFSEGAFRAEER